MQDRAVGLFEDEGAAETAREALVASGVDPDRMTIKRVLQPGHRGFANSETVHSLIHSPEVHEGDHVSDDAGTVILIVEMVSQSGDEDQSDAHVFDHDNEAVMEELEELGATETHVVEATPPLDL
jgi:hypothetical protein